MNKIYPDMKDRMKKRINESLCPICGKSSVNTTPITLEDDEFGLFEICEHHYLDELYKGDK